MVSNFLDVFAFGASFMMFLVLFLQGHMVLETLFGTNYLSKYRPKRAISMKGTVALDSESFTNFGILYEANRKITSIVGHSLMMFLCLYVIVVDHNVKKHIVFGYSKPSHLTMIIGSVYYLFDTGVIAFHPTKERNIKRVKIIHHLASAAFCFGMMHYQRGGIPASCFLLSAASNIPNDTKWLLQKYYEGNTSTRNWIEFVMINVGAAVYYVSVLIPVPLYFYNMLKDQEMTLWYLLTSYLHIQCIAAIALFGSFHVFMCKSNFQVTKESWIKYLHQKSG